MATSSKKAAACLGSRYSDDGHAHDSLYAVSGEAIAQGGTRPQEASPTTVSELGGTPVNDAALPCYYVPFHKDKRFVGREETLNMLRDILFVEGSQKVTLVGLGGVGKTQVALELAYWTKRNKPSHSVFWIPALSNATIEQAYVEMARMLPVQRRSEDEDVKELVRRYLSSDMAGPWLLILDNADDMDMLHAMTRYLPEGDGGLTLLTTRSRDVALSAAGGVMVELHEMSLPEAKSVLQKWLTTKDLGDDAAVEELLNRLTYLPLAIAQAAA